MKVQTLAQAIEHTLLRPTTTSSDIQKLCEEALKWNFYGVCISPIWIKTVAALLLNSSIKIITVAGFPTGAIPTKVKCYEVEEALAQGAHEVDFVLNIGWLKDGSISSIKDEFTQLVTLFPSTPLKVILETCYLSDEEKKIACHLAVETGITFVKTSTGFGTGGATLADVRLMKSIAPLVKASGGIKNTQTALEMIEVGATRLGTSSGVAIMEGLVPESDLAVTEMASQY